MKDSTKLEAAAEAFLDAYRKRWCSLAKGGVRSNAPLQKEAGELAVALNELRLERRG